MHESKALWASKLTLLIVLSVVAIKAVGFYISDSAAVLSSLIDSISDIGLSTITFLALRLSLKPADESHRHGHGKVEGVSALLQAAILTGSATFLLFTGIGRFLDPQPMHDHVSSAVLMTASLIASMMLTFIQGRAQKETGSLALAADKAHYSTDVWMNGAVILVVLLDYADLAPFWLDPLSAVLIAGLFARAAYQIGASALGMLMDREVEPEIHQKIMTLICGPKEVMGVHDLRCIRSGMKILVSLDLEVDGEQSLSSAHEIARETEYRILKEFPQAEILIHLDPQDDTEDSRHGGRFS